MTIKLQEVLISITSQNIFQSWQSCFDGSASVKNRAMWWRFPQVCKQPICDTCAVLLVKCGDWRNIVESNCFLTGQPKQPFLSYPVLSYPVLSYIKLLELLLIIMHEVIIYAPMRCNILISIYFVMYSSFEWHFSFISQLVSDQSTTSLQNHHTIFKILNCTIITANKVCT